MRIRSTALLTAAVAALILSSCGGGAQKLSHVFAAVPWQGPESLTYDLRDEGGKPYGTCVLNTQPDSEPGKTRLEHLCGGTGPERDDRSATVDSATLRPVTASRTISDPAKNTRTIYTTTYPPEASSVHLRADDNGKVRETDRNLPKPDKTSPDPGYYDDESLFWVMRGVPLERGYEGAYADVNASTGQVVTVTVRVESQEQVKVPAGTFNAWRVRLETSSITQTFWIEDGGARRVVQARIERVVYQLSGVR